MDPISKQETHTGTQCYADDISDINIANSGDFVDKINHRNQELNGILEQLDMGQNLDKEEHLICTIGTGSVKRAQDMHNITDEIRRHTQFGITTCQGKYLGNWTNTDGKTKKNTDARIKAMNEAYYAYRNFWNNKDIPLKTRANIFKGNVISAATSGMEAEVICKTEMTKIENNTIGLARKVLGKTATYKNGENWNSISNHEVRKKMGIHTICSTIEKRKLK